MIYFPDIGSYGRLGNQLFQYAASRSLALHHNTKLYLGPLENKSWHGQKCLLKYFNINYCDELCHSPKYYWEENNPFEINKNFYRLDDNTLLKGFFQSIFYFQKHINIIKKELTTKNCDITYLSYLRNKYKKYLVSIHIRRGDNTDGTDPSQNKLIDHYKIGGKYEEYLKSAVNKFKNAHFLIFTGGSRINNIDNDINWCHNYIRSLKWWENSYTISESNSTLIDFNLISGCDHNILSHVSSFGWWAAYLNKNSNAKRVAPLRYHPDIKNYTHREMFYPKDWILL